jgi:hypothetical protein
MARPRWPPATAHRPPHPARQTALSIPAWAAAAPAQPPLAYRRDPGGHERGAVGQLSIHLTVACQQTSALCS